MKVACPKCSAHYDVDKPGQYQCVQCQEVFTVEGEETTQAPELTPCPFCTAPVSPAARKCPHCGEWIKEKPKSRTAYLILAILLGNWGIAEFYAGSIFTGIILLLSNIFALLFLKEAGIVVIVIAWIISLFLVYFSDVGEK